MGNKKGNKIMISVVIPVLNNSKITRDVLLDIRNNVKKPKEIFIIDDGSTENIKVVCDEFKDLNTIFVRHNENKGFNYSCNEGIKLSTGDYISFLNNDLILNKYFFKKIEESFLSNSKIGIVCPNTIKDKQKVFNSVDEKVILRNMKKREGWAFTVRTSFIKRIDLIPTVLRTYCGDDYIFYSARKLNYDCLKMNNNYIFHYGSLTLRVTPAVFGEREREKIIWNEIKNK